MASTLGSWRKLRKVASNQRHEPSEHRRRQRSFTEEAGVALTCRSHWWLAANSQGWSKSSMERPMSSPVRWPRERLKASLRYRTEPSGPKRARSSLVEFSNVESCSGPTVMACSDEERCDMVAV